MKFYNIGPWHITKIRIYDRKKVYRIGPSFYYLFFLPCFAYIYSLFLLINILDFSFFQQKNN